MKSWSIKPVAEHELVAALNILHRSLPADEARDKAQADLQRLQTQQVDHIALVTASCSDTLIGACWIEIQAGNVGFVHPPVALLEGEERIDCECDLYQAAEQLARQAGVTWLQSLFPARDTEQERFLEAAGFQHLSTLSYQACLSKQFPDAEPRIRIVAVPYQPAERALLASVVSATYEGSLDSPALDGERDTDEILRGYEAIGNEGSRHWQLLVQNGEPIGCLLLAIHRPEQDRARPFGELVYWGLVPAARGQGLGREIVELALWQMRSLGMAKLLLAVDERNTPANRIYDQLGFFSWLTRHAWGKKLLE